MNIAVKSAGGVSTMAIETKLLNNRNIFLEGEISHESAMDFLKQLMFLTSEDSTKLINVLINSNGGDVNAGLIIYDAIASSIAPVRLFCIGKAYSMGAFIFLSGRNGRYMLENSELMLHEPLLGGRVGGNTTSIKEISDSLIKIRNKLNTLIAKNTGHTVKEIEKATNHDHYFDAKESVAFNLCDEIVDFSKIMEIM